jgi:hypothetical protein
LDDELYWLELKAMEAEGRHQRTKGMKRAKVLRGLHSQEVI